MIFPLLATTAPHLTECVTELHGLDILEVGCAHLHQGAAMSFGHIIAELLILMVSAIELVTRAEQRAPYHHTSQPRPHFSYADAAFYWLPESRSHLLAVIAKNRAVVYLNRRKRPPTCKLEPLFVSDVTQPILTDASYFHLVST